MTRHRFPLAFLFLLALPLFVAPLLRREVFVVRDHLDYFQPMRFFTAQELKAGRLPLWNPYSASGEPWLANPQTGVFYPPSWLFLVLPFATAYMLFLLFHVVLLGWTTYFLFARRAPPGAAMVGAAAVMFSGPLLSLLDVQNNLATLAWLPLALWCAAEKRPRTGAVALALAFLGGEPFFAALGGAMFAVVWIASAERGGRAKSVRGLLTVAALAFGLTAVQALPFLEMLRGSDRAGGMQGEAILRNSMPARDWVRVALPALESGSILRNAAQLDRRQHQQFIPVVYCGLAVVVLAVIGLITGFRRADVAGWIVLLVVSAILASGPSILTSMPLTLFRYPARFLPFAALAIAALAVAGWQSIRRERRWLDLVVVLVVVADLLPRARPLLVAEPWRREVVPYAREIGRDSKILRVGEIEPARRGAWMSGYLNLYDRRYEVFTAAPVASERYVAMHRQLQQTPTREELAALGVGFLLTRLPLHGPFMPLSSAGGVTMFRYERDSTLATLRTTNGERRFQPSIDTSHARVTVDIDSPGVLVLSQQAAPGWSVTVDGERATSLVIEGLFRGVRLTAGHHEVVWRYRPASLMAGAAITVIALLSLQLSVFVKRSRDKKFSSGRANSQ